MHTTIPTYREWRATLETWANSSPDALQARVTELANRIQEATGIPISPWTLRYHITGRYEDVGLGLARAVWHQLQADTHEEEQ